MTNCSKKSTELVLAYSFKRSSRKRRILVGKKARRLFPSKIVATGKSRWGVLGRVLRKAGKMALAHAPEIANFIAPGSGAMVGAAQKALQNLLSQG
jgi:hypothetical protein